MTNGNQPAASAAVDRSNICCPACGTNPKPGRYWSCNTRECPWPWDTFKSRGVCPYCGKKHKTTKCLACMASTPHEDWYGPGVHVTPWQSIPVSTGRYLIYKYGEYHMAHVLSIGGALYESRCTDYQLFPVSDIPGTWWFWLGDMKTKVPAPPKE